MPIYVWVSRSKNDDGSERDRRVMLVFLFLLSVIVIKHDNGSLLSFLIKRKVLLYNF